MSITADKLRKLPNWQLREPPREDWLFVDSTLKTTLLETKPTNFLTPPDYLNAVYGEFRLHWAGFARWLRGSLHEEDFTEPDPEERSLVTKLIDLTDDDVRASLKTNVATMVAVATTDGTGVLFVQRGEVWGLYRYMEKTLCDFLQEPSATRGP